MRKQMTEPEFRIWWRYLRSHEFKFTRQKPLGSYIADFYCSCLQLVIEIDGSQHNKPEAMEYDAMRTKYLESLGLTVLRFTNANVLKNLDGVVRRIEDYRTSKSINSL